MHTDQYLHYSCHHQISCEKNVACSLFNKVYPIITNKDNLTKENAGIKHLLRENGYQESITCKIFKRITNNHSLSQAKQQTQVPSNQEEDIRMSINLPCLENTSGKQHTLRSRKIRSIFCT